MLKTLIFLTLTFAFTFAQKQKFQTWTICGNTIDHVANNPLTGGNMCVGGGEIPTEAMKWFLNKANKGDVVMLIPSALNTKEQEKTFNYAQEWCKFSDVPINSVTAIVVNSPEIAYLPQVLEIVERAEAVYFTGGDQKHYWLYIKDSPLQNLLENLVETKRVAIGMS
jgi:cyanophycinase-like exopeptidase